MIAGGRGIIKWLEASHGQEGESRFRSLPRTRCRSVYPPGEVRCGTIHKSPIRRGGFQTRPSNCHSGLDLESLQAPLLYKEGTAYPTEVAGISGRAAMGKQDAVVLRQGPFVNGQL
jgi:hypothetical protein